MNRREEIKAARLRGFLVTLLLLGLAFLINVRLLGGFFLVDDFNWMEHCRAIDTARSFLIAPDGTFRPALILWSSVNWWTGGLEAWSYHLTNLLLHLGVCMLLVALGRRMLGETAAAAAGLFFILHPSSQNAVGWISGNSELLSSLGSLLCLYLAIRYLERPSTALLLGVWSAFALGILSKESAVFVPLLATAGSIGRVSPSARHRGSGMLVGLWLLLGSYIVARHFLVGAVDPAAAHGHPSWVLGSHAGGNLLVLLGALIIPFDMSLLPSTGAIALRDLFALGPGPCSPVAPGMPAMLMVILPAVIVAGRMPGTSSGGSAGGSDGRRVIFWILGWWLIVTMIYVPLTHISELYLYSIGLPFSLLFGAGVSALSRRVASRRGARRAFNLALIVLFMLYGGFTIRRNELLLDRGDEARRIVEYLGEKCGLVPSGGTLLIRVLDEPRRGYSIYGARGPLAVRGHVRDMMRLWCGRDDLAAYFILPGEDTSDAPGAVITDLPPEVWK